MKKEIFTTHPSAPSKQKTLLSFSTPHLNEQEDKEADFTFTS